MRTLIELGSKLLYPRRKGAGPPYDPASLQNERPFRPRSGIVQQNSLIGQPHRLRSMPQAARVPPANVRIGYVMAALRHPEPDSFDVQFRIAERDVDQQGPEARFLGFPHQRKCAVTSQCAFQNEAFALAEKRPATQYGVTRGGKGGARGLSRVKCGGNRVRIDDLGSPVEGNASGQGTLAGTVWPRNQREPRHFRRRSRRVRVTPRGAIRGVATRPTGPRNAFRPATPRRSAPLRPETPPDGRRRAPLDGRASQLARQPGQNRQSRCWCEPSRLVSHSRPLRARMEEIR